MYVSYEFLANYLIEDPLSKFLCQMDSPLGIVINIASDLEEGIKFNSLIIPIVTKE